MFKTSFHPFKVLIVSRNTIILQSYSTMKSRSTAEDSQKHSSSSYSEPYVMWIEGGRECEWERLLQMWF